MSIKQKIASLSFVTFSMCSLFYTPLYAVGNPGPSQIQNSQNAATKPTSTSQTPAQTACGKYKKNAADYKACTDGYNNGGILQNKDKVCDIRDASQNNACEYGYTKRAEAQKKKSAETGTNGANQKKKLSEVCKQKNTELKKACEKAWKSQVAKNAKSDGTNAASDSSINCNDYNFAGATYTKMCEKSKNNAEDEARGCGGVKTYFNFGCGSSDKEKGGSSSPIIALLNTIINWMTAIVSTIVVFAIVYGGFLYATAGDRADQQKTAITVITDAVIALLLLVLMYSILNFVIPGGVFN